MTVDTSFSLRKDVELGNEISVRGAIYRTTRAAAILFMSAAVVFIPVGLITANPVIFILGASFGLAGCLMAITALCLAKTRPNR